MSRGWKLVPKERGEAVTTDHTVQRRYDEIYAKLGELPEDEIDSKLEDAICSYFHEDELDIEAHDGDLISAYQELAGSEAEDDVLNDLVFNVEEQHEEAVRELLKKRFPILDP